MWSQVKVGKVNKPKTAYITSFSQKLEYMNVLRMGKVRPMGWSWPAKQKPLACVEFFSQKTTCALQLR